VERRGVHISKFTLLSKYMFLILPDQVVSKAVGMPLQRTSSLGQNILHKIKKKIILKH
jgi:hypothetical protein